MTEYDQPLIAIDVVPVTATPADGIRVGTSARLHAPFAGDRALPGVLLASGELLDDAARRALSMKAGVRGDAIRHLLQLGAFDRPGRDPRSHAVSIAFLAVLDPALPSDITWHADSDHPLGLPFDHDAIVAEARAQMTLRFLTDLAFTRALTGPAFSSATIARHLEQFDGKKPHRQLVQRRLDATPGLARSDQRPSSGGVGRPADFWEWS